MKEINMDTGEATQNGPHLSRSEGNEESGVWGIHSNNIVTLAYKNLNDEALVRLIVKTWDEDAFNEIVERYADKIYRLAIRITKNPSDAEEIMQDVLMILLEKLDTFREGSSFSTWLYRVILNASFMSLRAENKRKNNVSLENYMPYKKYGALKGIQEKDWSAMPDDAILTREVMEKIEKTVNDLPDFYRVVFHLRDVEQLTNEEVSKILGVSLPCVKSRIHRARLYLRDKLSDFIYEYS